MIRSVSGEVDAAFADLATAGGAGSTRTRRDIVEALFARASADEQRFLRGLITGDVRQGALDGVMQVAVAEAAGVPVTSVRRAAMLAGSLAPVAVAALTGGPAAWTPSTSRCCVPSPPCSPLPSPTLAEALVDSPEGWSVERKYDGIRIQAAQARLDVRLFTRSLDDVTARLPDVAEVIAALPADALSADGEAIALRPTAGRSRSR